MDLLLSMIQQNWAVISQAPFGVVSLLLVIATAAFSAGRFFLSEKVANLESRLAAKDETIANYREKLAGATPDEARSKIDELEGRLLALEPRLLSADQLAMFSAIVGTKPGSAQVVVDLASANRQQLARQLERSLKDVGWNVEIGSAAGVSNPPKTGISITPGSGEDTADANLLARAFDAIGVAYEILTPSAYTNMTQILISDLQL
ncbi:hypothetical protein E0H51_23905 [Rhizobium leguminosarum bv. viciae]|uniref:hypothetical protein n=1 Tax=Rhizobium leguminosarum TaxID=384 RepID=UPI00103DE17B|nr:hypothetical protein [Rhizobium leguminosarum]TBY73369.1 hypothetical protein E0H51_23905 [Rhizobium leguminosarum bv. viciae]